MIAFVSVGSTSFDALVETAVSKPFLDVLRAKGFSRLIVQRGRSTVKTPGTYVDNEDYVTFNQHGIEIELWKYKPSLRAEMEIADIVISHAGTFQLKSWTRAKENIDNLTPGSGTIIEVLRMRKPLIAVPNPTLLDDHQQELAQALEDHRYLRTSSVR